MTEPGPALRLRAAELRERAGILARTAEALEAESRAHLVARAKVFGIGLRFSTGAHVATGRGVSASATAGEIDAIRAWARQAMRKAARLRAEADQLEATETHDGRT